MSAVRELEDVSRNADRTHDRVRRNTPERFNTRIDAEIEQSLQYWALQPREAIDARVDELDREWDVERFLEMTASSFAIAGLVAGLRGRRRAPLFSAVVLAFLFQHAVQGWCPPLPVLRSFGIRTRKEIDREKYALKILRGDFARSARGAAAGAWV